MEVILDENKSPPQKPFNCTGNSNRHRLVSAFEIISSTGNADAGIAGLTQFNWPY